MSHLEAEVEAVANEKIRTSMQRVLSGGLDEGT